MSDATQLSDLANEALRKIGRNVVNCQKMEGMLKVLVSEANYSGPIGELETIVEKRRKATSRKSLGQLSEEFIKSIYLGADGSEDSRNDGSKAWLSVSFTVEEGEKLVSDVRQVHRMIVSERNELVHETLIGFDPMSEESCRQLIVDLDIQAERLVPEYKRLQELLRHLSEGRKVMAETMLSEEFRSKLTTNENDG